MNNKLRECFNSSPFTQSEMEWLQKEKERARENKQCVACSHYSYNLYVPGYITYYGDCDLGHTAWFGKSNHCKDWTDMRGEAK